MAKILVFAGTTEGRRLVKALLSASDRDGLPVEVTACVATEYGRDVLSADAAGENLTIRSGRLSEDEMAELMEEGFDAAIDTTHPYAVVVTDCIRQACGRTGTPYIRLLRESGSDAVAAMAADGADGGGAGKNGAGKLAQEPVFVEDAAAAAAFLSETEGPALLTTGSKELAAFTAVEGYRERFYARVLPAAEVVEKCEKLGFSGRRLICMQGPFSYEMNVGLLKQTGARYLVTKDSGRTGGCDEKLRAAEDLGVVPIIIGRKKEEGGKSPREVREQLSLEFGVNFDSGGASGANNLCRSDEPDGLCGPEGFAAAEMKADWFPLFTNIKDKHFVVVGAGRIAARRIRTLLQFSCRVSVIAPEVLPAVEQAAEAGKLTLVKRRYEEGDLRGADYALAAADDGECNSQVCLEARELGIPVNRADRREECDFYFPGVVKRGEIVAGFTAGGRNHGLVKKVSAKIREALEELSE